MFITERSFKILLLFPNFGDSQSLVFRLNCQIVTFDLGESWIVSVVLTGIRWLAQPPKTLPPPQNYQIFFFFDHNTPTQCLLLFHPKKKFSKKVGFEKRVARVMWTKLLLHVAILFLRIAIWIGMQHLYVVFSHTFYMQNILDFRSCEILCRIRWLNYTFLFNPL